MPNTLLVTVDSLRYDHYQYMEATREFLGESHPAAFATNTATPGSFQSIFGGTYVGEVGVEPDETFVPKLDREFNVGITTNRFNSSRYGYDHGFDHFSEPSREKGIKDRVAARMTPQSPLYKLASRVWNGVQSVQGSVSEVTREYRDAGSVVEEFLDTVEGHDDWFGWIHLMEPHHPYNPEDAPVSRAKAQQVTRRLLNGTATEREEELGRELYRGEVEETDDRLARLWDELSDDTQVYFCADHGELLGERGEWGHHATMCPEIIRVPVATRNIDIEGEVTSIVDIPTHLLGEEYADGEFDREVAFAAANGQHAAMNASHMATEDGVVTLDGEPAEDDELVAELKNWSRVASIPVEKDELPEDDLEALGYL
ncbi:sulfatase-like hydrolase/transferase [Haloferax marisrubri]|uniref:Sulfatase n=1 Tax=Haloferax marisrubri TaxID=1544719 RepID=A0A2P4NPM0_9EURY|nr:sulfatase-like hydrolase/transferase [Haloferax marisrubri]POG55028.1 sulfatase [Haloferax marisrubri]